MYSKPLNHVIFLCTLACMQLFSIAPLLTRHARIPHTHNLISNQILLSISGKGVCIYHRFCHCLLLATFESLYSYLDYQVRPVHVQTIDTRLSFPLSQWPGCEAKCVAC